MGDGGCANGTQDAGAKGPKGGHFVSELAHGCNLASHDGQMNMPARRIIQLM